MKKYILFIAFAVTITLFTSCAKDVAQITPVDVVLSPVLGLKTIRTNSIMVIGSYRVKNYSNRAMKVFGLKLDIMDQSSASNGFLYGIPGGGMMPINNVSNYIEFHNEVLMPGEETRNYNLQVQTTSYYNYYYYNYNNSSAEVDVKVKSIMTDQGEIAPTANSLITFIVIP
jgi:hypothetical protein